MKKIVFFMLVCTFAYNAHAQQQTASVKRFYLWDKPVTDSLTYRGIMPGNIRIITFFTATGEPVFVLCDSTQFFQAQSYFSDDFMKENTERIIGFEYVGTYLGKFSFLKKRDLRKMSGSQRKAAEAFNDIEKYTLMAQAPRSVEGVRNKNGDILLKVSGYVESPKPDHVLPEQKKKNFIPPPPIPAAAKPTPDKY